MSFTLISGFRGGDGEICTLWDITQHRVFIVYQHFGTSSRVRSPRIKTNP
jgi:hypothetical protein